MSLSLTFVVGCNSLFVCVFNPSTFISFAKKPLLVKLISLTIKLNAKIFLICIRKKKLFKEIDDI